MNCNGFKIVAVSQGVDHLRVLLAGSEAECKEKKRKKLTIHDIACLVKQWGKGAGKLNDACILSVKGCKGMVKL
jgi:hypothetical protein